MNYFLFFEGYYKKSKTHLHVYRILFYLMNIISFLLIFYSAVISVLHLAAVTSLGSSALRTAAEGSALTEIDNNYNNALIHLRNSISIGGANTSSYPIFTAIISAASSAIIGMVAFFSVNDKYKKAKVRIRELEYEKMLYDLNLAEYSDPNTKDKNLYEETVRIVNFISVKITRQSKLRKENNG
ncbi:DUF4231 domain-containing protein [Mycoplasmopsis agassizii]|uniref:DUF4231 domain-containing protein n=2 Tax=Mycoplasmopsis agassizii TaxID=33922 RepID=A0ABX4H551_9BACT|nr:DUF4231 domain-containing protein [Mycoplasmopsis agassizii]PAF55021.1 DUF4231 domain-containing protein [Mycoplasmopsis agassizii]SMC17522.1 Protein of unknown function [Mycoplasmopsis agassizii]